MRRARVDANEVTPAEQEAFDAAKFNLEMKALYNHPACYFCEEREACFCAACIAPTWEEIHHPFYCHRCHAEHLGVRPACPTCKRPWPKGRR